MIVVTSPIIVIEAMNTAATLQGIAPKIFARLLVNQTWIRLYSRLAKQKLTPTTACG